MAEGEMFYITVLDGSLQLKREGGTKVLKVFRSREEALQYAQVMMAKQRSSFRIQDRQGNWQTL